MASAYRTARMPQKTQREFVEAVMAKTGLSQTELGVELRKPNAYQTVHGWITGKGKLLYEDTIAMLAMCGWLNMSEASVENHGEETTLEERAMLLLRHSPSFDARLESLSKAAAQIVEAQTRTLELLEELERVQRSPVASKPKARGQRQ